MPQLQASDFTTWEAVYDDGRVIREKEGALYAGIDRNRIRSFRFVKAGEILIEMFIRDGRTGHNLVYRRRTVMTAGGSKKVYFLAGFAPMGPVVAIDPDNGLYEQREFFSNGDAIFRPPTPIPEEGESFSFDQLTMRSDARLIPSQITLPSGRSIKNPELRQGK